MAGTINFSTGLWVDLIPEEGDPLPPPTPDHPAGSVWVDVESQTYWAYLDADRSGFFTQGDTNGATNVTGTEGSDGIIGDDTANIINGLGGVDFLIGSGGDDVIDGGNGDDEIGGGSGNDTLYGGQGEDSIVGGDDNDVIHGGDNDDDLYGDAGDDVLYGDSGDDTLSGGDDDDELFGGDDNDELDGGDGEHTLYGDAGDDTLFGEKGSDELHGGDDKDVLEGQEDDDTLYGDAGNDQLNGGDGNDTLYGGANDDLLLGDDFSRTSDDGTAEVVTSPGNDMLYGGAGNDAIFDIVVDSFNVGSGTETLIDAGSGKDYIFIGNSFLSGSVSGGGDTDTDILSVNYTGQVFDTAADLSLLTLTDIQVLETNYSTITATAEQFSAFGTIRVRDALPLGGWLGDLFGPGFDDTDRAVELMVAPKSSSAVSDTTLDLSLQLGDGGGRGASITGSKDNEIITVSQDVAAPELQIAPGVFAANIVDGAGGNDTITGGDKVDLLIGGLDNDKLTGAGGADGVFGGAGDDTLFVTEGDAVSGEIYDGGDDHDTLDVSGDVDFTGVVFASIEALTLGSSIPGSSALLTPDQLEQNGGGISDALEIKASSGTDAVIVNFASGATVDLSGWTFSNWTPGVADNRIVVNGSADDDDITGSNQFNLLIGGGGDDIITGGTGKDFIGDFEGTEVDIFGDAGDDLIGIGPTFTSGEIDGGADKDLLGLSADTDLSAPDLKLTSLEVLETNGKTVTHTAEGFEAFDTIWVNGGEANALFPGLVEDKEGHVTLVLKSVGGQTELDLTDELKDYHGRGAIITGSSDDEKITVSQAIDTPTISTAQGTVANKIEGMKGADTLIGGDSADYLDGGDGDDTLSGGLGDDKLWGGQGNDTFYGIGTDLTPGPNPLGFFEAGDNLIDGGSGTDSLIFPEAVNAYSLTVFSWSRFLRLESDYQIKIGSNKGTDTAVSGIEKFIFDDDEIDLLAMQAVAAVDFTLSQAQGLIVLLTAYSGGIGFVPGLFLFGALETLKKATAIGVLGSETDFLRTAFVEAATVPVDTLDAIFEILPDDSGVTSMLNSFHQDVREGATALFNKVVGGPESQYIDPNGAPTGSLKSEFQNLYNGAFDNLENDNPVPFELNEETSSDQVDFEEKLQGSDPVITLSD